MQIFRRDNGHARARRGLGERFIDPREVANFIHGQVQSLRLLKIDDGEQNRFQTVEIKRRFRLENLRGFDRA